VHQERDDEQQSDEGRGPAGAGWPSTQVYAAATDRAFG